MGPGRHRAPSPPRTVPTAHRPRWRVARNACPTRARSTARGGARRGRNSRPRGSAAGGWLHGSEVAHGMGYGRHRAPGGRHGPEVVLSTGPGRQRAPGGRHGPEVVLGTGPGRHHAPDGPHGPRWGAARAVYSGPRASAACERLHGFEVALGAGPGRHRAPSKLHGPEVGRSAGKPHRSELTVGAGRHHGPGWCAARALAATAHRASATAPRWGAARNACPTRAAPTAPRWCAARAKLRAARKYGVRMAARLRSGARRGRNSGLRKCGVRTAARAPRWRSVCGRLPGPRGGARRAPLPPPHTGQAPRPEVVLGASATARGGARRKRHGPEVVLGAKRRKPPVLPRSSP